MSEPNLHQVLVRRLHFLEKTGHAQQALEAEEMPQHVSHLARLVERSKVLEEKHRVFCKCVSIQRGRAIQHNTHTHMHSRTRTHTHT